MKSTQSAKPPRWHILYYVLALFDLVTICFSLFLNHQTLKIFSESTIANSAWVSRADQFEDISRLAGLVNAPGNDVFESRDPFLERKKKEKAFGEFKAAVESARVNLANIADHVQKNLLAAQLGKVEASMGLMNDEAELIFGSFTSGDELAAASRMATMDRRFAELNANLSELRTLVRVFQRDNLALQESEARSLSRYEFLIAFTILMIICVVAIYGHWLSKKIEATNAIILAQRTSLENSARLASLGTMSAGIAHEINNPLTVIHGNATIIKEKLDAGKLTQDIALKSASKILKTCERIRDIVDGLRTFSRDGSNDDFAPSTVGDIIEDSISLCGQRFKSNGVDLRIQVADQNAKFECRQVQICQVIVNLLVNAFDAVVKTDNSWVELSCNVSGDKVCFAVTDSGKGIPEDVVKRMMTPFFTTKEVGKGTGLGLSISHGIVELHGGRLFYDSTSPHTRFAIEIPRFQSV